MRDGRDAAHEVRKDLLSSHYHSLSLCYILQTTKIRVTLSLISKSRVAMLRDIVLYTAYYSHKRVRLCDSITRPHRCAVAINGGCYSPDRTN